jgi:hypothetical protein
MVLISSRENSSMGVPGADGSAGGRLGGGGGGGPTSAGAGAPVAAAGAAGGGSAGDGGPSAPPSPVCRASVVLPSQRTGVAPPSRGVSEQQMIPVSSRENSKVGV